MADRCNVVHANQLPYQVAWDLQNQIAAARAAGHVDDTLLLLEHPHTYTLGRAGHAENLLLSPDEQAARGVTVEWVDRGGDITYHGPGQLVGYPILFVGQIQHSGRLPQADYVGYVRRLETMLIEAISAFGIEGYAEAGYTGVWVAGDPLPQKIAAIGVKVNAGGVSTHGFALNVNTDLSYFAGIVPCGIAERPVTSLAVLLGRRVEMDEVMAEVERAFARVFERDLHAVGLAELQASLPV